jgi:hypothetical protein
VSGSDLYAASGIADSENSYVAKWSGSSWSALDSGMDDKVYALAVSGSNLYAGGGFTTAGGSAANFIAKWDGSRWSALGFGMDNDVFALAVSGSDLYAAGNFTMAGTGDANCIAKWNGSSWSPLGSGTDRPVYALAVSDSDLYAGGDFTTAGGKVSGYAARAIIFPPAIVFRGGAAAFTNKQFHFSITGASGQSVILQASTNLLSWLPLQTNVLGTNLLDFIDPESTNLPARYYRLQLLLQ